MLPYAATLLLLAAGACAQDSRAKTAFKNTPEIAEFAPEQLLRVIFRNAEADLGNSLDLDDVSGGPLVETTPGYRGMYTIIALLINPPGGQTTCPGGQRLVQMRTNCPGGSENKCKDAVRWNLGLLDYGRRNPVVIVGFEQIRLIGVDPISENLNADCFYFDQFMKENDMTKIVSGNFFYTESITKSIL